MGVDAKQDTKEGGIDAVLPGQDTPINLENYKAHIQTCALFVLRQLLRYGIASPLTFLHLGHNWLRCHVFLPREVHWNGITGKREGIEPVRANCNLSDCG